VHLHRRQVALATAGVCVGLGAGAAVLALSASAAGSGPPSPLPIQVDSVYCNGSGGAGQAAHGSCIFVLTDGRRFECPLRFGNAQQTLASLERAPACRRLTPLRIPAAWKAVLRRLYAVQACLKHHGIRTNGGPALTRSEPKRTPIGELDLATKPMAIIGFYTSAQVARRAEPRVQTRVAQSGGSVERHGAVSVVWISPPSSGLDATVSGCVSA